MPFYAASTFDAFYNIAPGTVLPPGDYVIESLLGEKLSVDREAVAAYVMAEEAAREHVTAYQKKIEKLALDLQRFAGALQASVNAPLDPKLIPARVDEILQLLGVSTEALRRDPKGTLAVIIQKLRATRDEEILAL